jgi:hypothetical protein
MAGAAAAQTTASQVATLSSVDAALSQASLPRSLSPRLRPRPSPSARLPKLPNPPPHRPPSLHRLPRMLRRRQSQLSCVLAPPLHPLLSPLQLLRLSAKMAGAVVETVARHARGTRTSWAGVPSAAARLWACARRIRGGAALDVTRHMETAGSRDCGGWGKYCFRFCCMNCASWVSGVCRFKVLDEECVNNVIR